MTLLLHIAEIAALAVLGGLTGYLALLSLLSLAARRRPPARTGTPLRLAVMIPAHDEEAAIGRTLRSVSALDYPPERTETFVVADNCTDRTAEVARAHGATVLERTDADRRGKGQALRWAFDDLLGRDPAWDGFVVIDADSTISRNFLRVMDAHLASGAEAVQAADLVEPNPESWSSEVTRLGFTLYNYARPLGRSVFGGSAGLRGNGMGFGAGLLRRVPWNAFGVTEDLQYGLELVLRGVPVRFAPSATVLATMPSEAENAESQRARWEQGRAPVRGRYGPLLLSAFLRRGSFRLLDAWIDLMTPPFVQLMAIVGAALLLHAAASAFFPEFFLPYLAAWAAVVAAGLVHVLAGLVSARADARLYGALLAVPRFALWKFLLRRKRRTTAPPSEWVRTTRETPGTGDPGTDDGARGAAVFPHTHHGNESYGEDSPH